MLEVLYFLHYEGKTKTSALEENLADYLYDDLMEREMTVEEFLMVATYLSMLDNPNSKFEDARATGMTSESMHKIHISFAVEAESYLPIVKQGFITVIISFS